MSKQSHTPGPWHVEKTWQGTAILDDAQYGRWTQIAMAYQANDVFGDGEKRIISHDEAKANAHLIAAAPEMLEALLKMQRTFEAMGPSFAAAFADTRDVVYAAIAKARGEK